MTFDLIFRNATLPDGRKQQDVAVAAGRIAAIGPRLEAEAGETIDARGLLLSPPFVDSHFHMDATLSLGSRASTSPARCSRGSRSGAS